MSGTSTTEPNYYDADEDEQLYGEKLSVCLSLYIYIYIVLFGPVKPELGVIPSEQENHSGAEHLNFPGGELNVIFYRAIFL